MDKKIITASEQIIKSLKRDLKAEFSDIATKKNTGTIISSCSRYGFVISKPENSDELMNQFKALKANFKIAIVISDYNKDLTIKMNTNDIPVLYAYDLEHSSYTGFISNFFLISKDGLPSFQEIQNRVIQECVETPNHYNLKASNFWAKYRNYNYAINTWSDDEMKKSTWEIEIFNSVLKAAKGRYGNNSEFSDSTFAPMSSYQLQDGTKVHNPDFQKLKVEEGLDEYVYERYQSVDFILFKRRFLEFLIFIKSKNIKKPGIFSELPILLEEEIKYINTNKEKIPHFDLHISDIIQRYLEVLSQYYSIVSKNEEYFAERVQFINNYIKELSDKKAYRWIIDIPRSLLLYPKLMNHFEDKTSELIDLLSQGESFFQLQKNPSLQEACLESIADLKKYRSEEYDFNAHLAEVRYQHALQMVSQGSHMGGTSLLEDAIKLLKEANNKDEAKIKKLLEMHQKWAKIAPTEMTRYESKIDLPLKEIKAERERYVSVLCELKTPKERVHTFFSDTDILLDDETFQSIYEKTKGGIASMMSSTIIGDIGTIKKPLNEEDQEEINEFRWYGTIINIYLNKVIDLFSKMLEENIFDLNDISNSLKTNKAISEDDFLYLSEGIELFKLKRFASSNHILFHLIERFFRKLSSDAGKGVKHKAKGVEHNVSLDDMIKSSECLGFPKGLIRFFRYFYTRTDGINIRNNTAHSLIDYKFINQEGISYIVLWSVLFCYLNLTPIEPKEDSNDSKS